MLLTKPVAQPPPAGLFLVLAFMGLCGLVGGDGWLSITVRMLSD